MKETGDDIAEEMALHEETMKSVRAPEVRGHPAAACNAANHLSVASRLNDALQFCNLRPGGDICRTSCYFFHGTCCTKGILAQAVDVGAVVLELGVPKVLLASVAGRSAIRRTRSVSALPVLGELLFATIF